MSGALSFLYRDAVVASVDLIGRTGARSLELGFVRDGVPVSEADWWAHAQFRGARVGVEHHAGPLEALARRLLAGATCRRCGKPIQLSDTAAGCRWTRHGDRWQPGCGKPVDLSIATAPLFPPDPDPRNACMRAREGDERTRTAVPCLSTLSTVRNPHSRVNAASWASRPESAR